MSGTDHLACLLAGSNIHPEQYLPLAIEQLQKLMTLLRVSRVWESAPVGTAGPNFLNAAILAQTPLDQNDLKTGIIAPLEAKLGRVRTPDKNAPRTIDLDIILYDGQVIDLPLWRFAHRAVPVAELLPDLRSEAGGTLKEVAEKFIAEGSIHLRTDVRLPVLE